ncbi:CBS domain-containing protein [Geopsychrobacter electrodiphilus]|uniref:CBS domain-containing protein n=1 Tax=Geopsychrobacter electrodiphilus TaxID=225196 RepID=UPI00037BA69B|nr:CBS domain-containing protein [Geopsychrobacter electrodiphilus]
MDVITTHINADFDCLGAMIAARRLYPEAVLVFPGSQERGLRAFLLDSTLYAYNFKRLKEINLGEITRLILVDVRQAARIGPFASVAVDPRVELHIFDHHLSTIDSLKGDFERIEDVGATTTIMTRTFVERGIVPTPDEATMMMLGLYEDTGNLLYGSTCAEDFSAARFLFEQGANLNTVADFLVREMTPEQVDLLNRLLKSCRRIQVHGVEIAIAQASLDYYVTDIASLAHKLKDIENLSVLIVAVRMTDRVFMVARSRIAAVDVGELLQGFGGGGHSFAASATVRDMPLEQLLDTLERRLHEQITPRMTAGSIMSTPVKSLALTSSIRQAAELLTRLNFNAAPVLDGTRIVGIVARQMVEKALHHQMGDTSISEIMSSDFSQASSGTDILDLKEMILAHRQRFIPIIDEGVLVGVVTRTDLLQHLVGEQGSNGGTRSRLKRKSVSRLLPQIVPLDLLSLLRRIGELAESSNVKAYLVGGFVRDLLLRQPNDDVDIVVEGEGISFAEQVARMLDGRVKAHPKFGTAVVVSPEGLKIDIATARIEYYAAPAALPEVEYASIRHDLYRRDFSINTLAMILNRSNFGQILDFFNGQRDLKDQAIRVLHNLSFVEDPTRAFRAVRFEQRLGFKIGGQTERLLKNAVANKVVARVSGRRILNELRHILGETHPLPALKRLDSLGLLPFVSPSLRFDEVAEGLFVAADKALNWFELLFTGEDCDPFLVRLLCLFNDLPRRELKKTLAALELKLSWQNVLSAEVIQTRKALAFLTRATERSTMPAASRIYHWLNPLSLESLIYLLALSRSEDARRMISTYVTRLRHLRIELDGHDLTALGMTPGPQYTRILTNLLDARIDGKILSREDEVQWVKKHFML